MPTRPASQPPAAATRRLTADVRRVRPQAVPRRRQLRHQRRQLGAPRQLGVPRIRKQRASAVNQPYLQQRRHHLQTRGR